MRALVLGSTGMLGLGVCKSLREHGAEVDGTFQKDKFNLVQKVDLNEAITYDATKSLNSDLRLPVNVADYDFVVNCIGVINRKADLNQENTILLNSIFPRRASRLCKSLGVPFIHITTDCVYDGKQGMYNEDSMHTALDIYGRTKSLGEPSDCMVLRTSIIGEEIHTYSSLIEWVKAQEGTTVQGYTNHFWNGITTINYGDLIYKIIKDNLYKEELFHIFSPEPVSKFTLVKMIADKFRLNLNIVEHEAEVAINRTLDSKKDLVGRLNIASLEKQIQQL
tara:strand:- start:554 stop:1390 length:837 start_codon:yes stop_codon:yes gene_type:complete